MLAAMKGVVKGERIILDEGDLRPYEGRQVVVTFLDPLERKDRPEKKIDFSKYGWPTERGQHVDEYMKEMRENDRTWADLL